ncbi:hypothetical protein Tco_0047519 [Tanacetum coccineum]
MIKGTDHENWDDICDIILTHVAVASGGDSTVSLILESVLNFLYFCKEVFIPYDTWSSLVSRVVASVGESTSYVTKWLSTSHGSGSLPQAAFYDYHPSTNTSGHSYLAALIPNDGDIVVADPEKDHNTRVATELCSKPNRESVVWDDVNEEEEYPSILIPTPVLCTKSILFIFPEDEPKFDEDEVDIEEGDGYKFQETDSESFIRDENYETEEYPGSCSTLYSSHPCFDCYGDEEGLIGREGPERSSKLDCAKLLHKRLYTSLVVQDIHSLSYSRMVLPRYLVPGVHYAPEVTLNILSMDLLEKQGQDENIAQHKYHDEQTYLIKSLDDGIDEGLIRIKGSLYSTKVQTFNDYVYFLNLVKQDEIVDQEWDYFRNRFNKALKWFYTRLHQFETLDFLVSIHATINGTQIQLAHLDTLTNIVEYLEDTTLNVQFCQNFDYYSKENTWTRPKELWRELELKRCYNQYLDVFTSYFKTARAPRRECIRDFNQADPNLPSNNLKEGTGAQPNAGLKGKEKVEHFGVKLEGTSSKEDTPGKDPIPHSASVVKIGLGGRYISDISLGGGPPPRFVANRPNLAFWSKSVKNGQNRPNWPPRSTSVNRSADFLLLDFLVCVFRWVNPVKKWRREEDEEENGEERGCY